MRGRYSLLGIDPDLVFRATGSACEINRQWREDRAAFAPLPGDSLTELRALIDECRIEMPPEAEKPPPKPKPLTKDELRREYQKDPSEFAPPPPRQRRRRRKSGNLGGSLRNGRT